MVPDERTGLQRLLTARFWIEPPGWQHNGVIRSPVRAFWAQLAKTPPGRDVAGRGVTAMTRVYGHLQTSDDALTFVPQRYRRYLPHWVAPWETIRAVDLVNKPPWDYSSPTTDWPFLRVTFMDDTCVYFQGTRSVLTDWLAANWPRLLR